MARLLTKSKISILVSIILLVSSSCSRFLNVDNSNSIQGSYDFTSIKVDPKLNTEKCIIEGKIIDAKTKNIITSAQVSILDTNIITKSDFEGRFEVVLATGKYRVLVSQIGYDEVVTEEIVLEDRNRIVIYFYLGVTIE